MTDTPSAQTHTVAFLPAQLHQLELADARILQCAWCDARSFTNPCHICAARYPESGKRSAS